MFDQHPILKVHRNIGTGTEHTHLTLHFHADAAGSDIGDTTVLESDAGISNIGSLRQYGGSAGIDAFDFGIDQSQNDIDIMYHQIQHHTDVIRARVERRQAMRFDKKGFCFSRIQTTYGRVEALQMTNLQNYVFLLSNCNQIISFLDCNSNRLFN